MKKSLFLLGAAVAAFASCTNEEVMDMPQNRAINFDGYVENNVRAVTEVTKDALTGYYVFGSMSADKTTWDGTGLFNNELSTERYYWVVGNYYRFGAYADGNNGRIESNVSFDAANQKLTFANYTPEDAKDLVAGFGEGDASTTIPTQAVPLSFKHLLSQVGFTFKTEVGTNYTLNISNIEINNAVKTATGEYTAAGVTWTGTSEATAAYSYTDVTDLANATNKTSQQFKLVIPQAVPADGTSKITVTFDASIKGAGLGATREDITVELAAPDNFWKNGYRYNYTATINAEQIIDEIKKIEFTVQELPEWQDATMGGSETMDVPAVDPGA